MWEPWDELEYRELFSAFPIQGTAPSGEGLAQIERRLNHSRGGIVAQWKDAKDYARVGRRRLVTA
jgi:hypothetical protein